ncbi:hypothetical protein P9112_005084 [Eukaryota sp. TZLM1-RC]
MSSLSLNDLSATIPHSSSFISDADQLLQKLDSAIKVASSNSDDSAMELNRLRSELKARIDVLVMRISESQRLLTQQLEEEKSQRSRLESRLSALESSFSSMHKVTTTVDPLISQVEDLYRWKEEVKGAVKASAESIGQVASSLKTHSNEVYSRLSEMGDSLSSVTSLVSNLSDKCHDVSDDAREAHEKLEKFSHTTNQSIDDVANSVDGLENKLTVISSSFDERLNNLEDSDDVTQLRSQLEQLSSKVDVIQQDSELLTSQVHSIDLACDSAKQESHEAVKSLRSLSQTIQSFAVDEDFGATCHDVSRDRQDDVMIGDDLIGDRDVEVFLRSIKNL